MRNWYKLFESFGGVSLKVAQLGEVKGVGNLSLKKKMPRREGGDFTKGRNAYKRKGQAFLAGFF